MDSLGDIECGGGVCDVISKLNLHIREPLFDPREKYLVHVYRCNDCLRIHVKHNKQAESKSKMRKKKKQKAQTTWMEDFCIRTNFSTRTYNIYISSQLFYINRYYSLFPTVDLWLFLSFFSFFDR